MIQISNPADCCGCSACASVCAHDAISMKPDALGFLYPVVDKDKCINCGLCEKVCAFNDHYDTSLNLPEPLAYGARQKNIDEVLKSRSGAVFAAISDQVLGQGGVVYGAGYGDHFLVVHKRATTKEERDEFRGSKYVQSDMNTIFRQVKQDLRAGRLVLFSGTPCQTSGLNSYVGRRLRDNLILMDIICHGVASPYYWRDYLKYLESQNNQLIKNVNFRDKKKYGWHDHHESFTLANDQIAYPLKRFYDSISFRHSCPNCHFCNIRRPSDLTIGDFWGVEKQDVNFNHDDKGANLVLCNTEKGKKLFDEVRSALLVIEALPEYYMQPNLRQPTDAHPGRNLFEKDFCKRGFPYVFSHDYWQPPMWRRVLYKINRIFRAIFHV